MHALLLASATPREPALILHPRVQACQYWSACTALRAGGIQEEALSTLSAAVRARKC